MIGHACGWWAARSCLRGAVASGHPPLPLLFTHNAEVGSTATPSIGSRPLHTDSPSGFSR
jgi:hypothetical protein